MRNQMTLCPKCDRQSRTWRGWYCPYCDYLKLDKWGNRVTALTAKDVYVGPKPRKVNANVAAKAQRKAEKEQLAEDIAGIDRSKLPVLNLRPKAGLRRA